MTGDQPWEVMVLGAGAAGLMCAITAAQRGRRVVVVDHGRHPGEKIRISGGGRCNFTNLHMGMDHYLSQNPAFCISALSRFTPRQFMDGLDRHGIGYGEKKAGQMFCTGSARQVVEMLLTECHRAGVTLHMGQAVNRVERCQEGFLLHGDGPRWLGQSLVVATGGKSFANLGASDFGHRVARSFGLPVVATRPGLTPLTFDGGQVGSLSGISLAATVSCGVRRYRDGLLFTHRGFSGPAILQISSHWRPGDALQIDFTPDDDIAALLKAARQGRTEVLKVLSALLPHRLVESLVRPGRYPLRCADLRDGQVAALAAVVQAHSVTPTGHEGYRKAEVTVGGVDTGQISSKTMGCLAIPGLFFVGEVLDVTGELGGYNLHWAWASGYAAGSFA